VLELPLRVAGAVEQTAAVSVAATWWRHDLINDVVEVLQQESKGMAAERHRLSLTVSAKDV
jgi:hypothetical protein